MKVANNTRSKVLIALLIRLGYRYKQGLKVKVFDFVKKLNNAWVYSKYVEFAMRKFKTRLDANEINCGNSLEVLEEFRVILPQLIDVNFTLSDSLQVSLTCMHLRLSDVTDGLMRIVELSARKGLGLNSYVQPSSMVSVKAYEWIYPSLDKAGDLADVRPELLRLDGAIKALLNRAKDGTYEESTYGRISVSATRDVCELTRVLILMR